VTVARPGTESTTGSQPIGEILIDLDGLDRLTGDVLLVDTRRGPDYRRGHIPGAIHLDTFPYANERTDTAVGWPAIEEDWRQAFAGAGLTLSDTVVFYDAGFENRAPRNAVTLSHLGHPRVFVLVGGFAAWVAAGREQTRQTTTRPPAPVDTLRLKTRDDVFAVFDRVVDALQSADVRLLDVREQIEYVGRRRIQRNPRLGRIPGATHVVWHDLLVTEPDGRRSRPRPVAEIRQKLAAAGVEADSDVIVYCQKSHRASNTLLLLRSLGYTGARVYPGSYREWSRRREQPVEKE
jgi:thiosulfate/3-mercaptopyruvate sulfurtransferase